MSKPSWLALGRITGLVFVEGLSAQFEKTLIPLKDICEEYFGLSEGEARKRANLNQLPVPTIRLSDSQKSPLYVHVADLATLIDARRKKASEQWRRSQI